jgi:hypothetical protein
MYKSILLAAVCAISSVACEITCIEDCDGHGSKESSVPHSAGASGKTEGPSPSANASGGTGASDSGSGGSASCADAGGTTSSSSSAGHSPSAATPCAKESDCSRGFNCDYERKECAPADAETCAELTNETDCDNRNDCVSIYAGENCSCGPECTCIGGEPGCVCQSFAFFQCELLEH